MKTSEGIFLGSDETALVGRGLLCRLIDGTVSVGYIPVSWTGDQYSFRQAQIRNVKRIA